MFSILISQAAVVFSEVIAGILIVMLSGLYFIISFRGSASILRFIRDSDLQKKRRQPCCRSGYKSRSSRRRKSLSTDTYYRDFARRNGASFNR